MTIGQAIRKMREEKGYTVSGLAKAVSIDRANIHNWEADRNYPSLFMLMCVADELGCTLDELVGRKTTPK